jgi:hypothetical protein
MRHVLKLHRHSRCAALSRIEVEVSRPRPGHLLLRYRATGNIARLRLPRRVPAARADGLWRHTCFEAFLGAPGSAGYCEFNFSPSRQWAAYRFHSYRRGMRGEREVPPPRIATRSTPARYELQVFMRLDRHPLRRAAWRLGLSAVIEEESGNKSYWALAHPRGRPDFHHSAGFACKLPPVEQT